MRKITLFVIALWIALVLSGCIQSQTADSEKMSRERDGMQDNTSATEHDVKIGDSIWSIKTNHKDDILLEQHSCIAWMDSKGYKIACPGKDGATIRAVIKFSENLELREAIGLEPIEDINQKEWVGKKEADFISKYGSCHFDFGSGAYIPSYISENGIIYFLHVFDGTINSISYFSPNDQSQGQYNFVTEDYGDTGNG